MSVFKGSITEYPGVIVDHFTPFNCSRGRAFFLSHCHKDHMTGLGSHQILDALQRKRAALYCSEVTRSLLLQDPGFTQLAPHLRGLPTDEPVPMNLEACIDSPALNFTVTLLPAGHCPGSSMFFYQGSNGSVLYTGDFRLTLEETKRLKSLHCGGRLLEVKSLYLDTTFCHPMATTIPSREVSRDHIIKIAESWLSQDPSNVLHLQLGMFGYEHIYMGLARRFDTKVHIARWRLNAYRDLPAVAACLTVDGESTRIHACSFRKGMRRCPGVPCGCRYSNRRPPPVLSIKPSTLWFLSNSGTLTEPYKYLPEYNVYRVLHSMHASYTELCDFITYLRPSRIVPCVVPLGDSSLADVNVRLKDLLPQVEVVAMSTAIKGCVTPVTPPPRRPRTVDSDECSNDTIDEFASSEESSQKHNGALSDSSSKPFVLPAMFTDHTEEVGVVRLYEELGVVSQGRVPESLCSSSTGATLGSLEQTPIDLSPDNTPSEPDVIISHTKCAIIDKLSAEGSGPVPGAYCIRCESPTAYSAGEEYSVSEEGDLGNGHVTDVDSPIVQESSSPTSKSTSPVPEHLHSPPPTSLTRRGHSPSPSVDSWHLTLESSTEEELVTAHTDSSDSDQTLTPEPKRLKLNAGDHQTGSNDHQTGSNDHQTGSNDHQTGSNDHQTGSEDHHPPVTSTVMCSSTNGDSDHLKRDKRSLSVEIIEHRVIDYIDLTQDQPSLSEDGEWRCEGCVGGEWRCEGGVGGKCDVSPSDSRQSRSLSPLCLPPTPGRENVDSILERKNIAF